jgi:hypothetical protein
MFCHPELERSLHWKIDLQEAQCVIGDVFGTLSAYEDWVARHGCRKPQRVAWFLDRLFLANEEMSAWVAEQAHWTQEETVGDTDLAILMQGVREAALQIQQVLLPLVSRDRAAARSEFLRDDLDWPQFPPQVAPLLADTLSCLALLARPSHMGNGVGARTATTGARASGTAASPIL